MSGLISSPFLLPLFPLLPPHPSKFYSDLLPSSSGGQATNSSITTVSHSLHPIQAA